jgi:hypothetical protein
MATKRKPARPEHYGCVLIKRRRLAFQLGDAAARVDYLQEWLIV